MNTAQLVHIVVTIVIIIGAGAIALFCDLLKSNNERLRELNLELRVRNEEEQRRTELALEQLRRGSQPPAPGRPARTSEGTTRGKVAVVAGLQPGATLEEARRLARSLLATAANEQPRPPERGDRVDAKPLSDQPTGSARNWDLLLKRASRLRIDVTAAAVNGKPRGELIAFESIPAAQGGGRGVFASPRDSRSPFRGLVAAIGLSGLNEMEAADHGPAAAAVVQAATAYLETLVGPGEFAFQPAADRYVIATPDREGGAQRRFDELAGKLRNFQLQGQVSNSELFSCGGYEADGEPLDQCVRAAGKLMEQSRRTLAAPVLGTACCRTAAV